MDAAYYIAKELLMTERTYKKDLQVIAVVRIFNALQFSQSFDLKHYFKDVFMYDLL